LPAGQKARPPRGVVLGWRGPQRGEPATAVTAPGRYPATAVTAPGRYAARPAYAAAPLEKRGRPARAGLGRWAPTRRCAFLGGAVGEQVSAGAGGGLRVHAAAGFGVMNGVAEVLEGGRDGADALLALAAVHAVDLDQQRRVPAPEGFRGARQHVLLH